MEQQFLLFKDIRGGFWAFFLLICNFTLTNIFFNKLFDRTEFYQNILDALFYTGLNFIVFRVQENLAIKPVNTMRELHYFPS
jgi:hypothetical protein